MTSKSDKEKKSAGKTGSPVGKATAKKDSPKPKKQVEEDDDDELDDDEMETPAASKKAGKVAAASKKSKDDDDDDDVVDEPDEWEKPEEEENWDPDFDEFDVPKSKGKKSPAGKKGGGEDDFKFEDDEFKDLFNDKDYDDEEDDY